MSVDTCAGPSKVGDLFR